MVVLEQEIETEPEREGEAKELDEFQYFGVEEDIVEAVTVVHGVVLEDAADEEDIVGEATVEDDTSVEDDIVGEATDEELELTTGLQLPTQALSSVDKLMRTHLACPCTGSV